MSELKNQLAQKLMEPEATPKATLADRLAEHMKQFNVEQQAAMTGQAEPLNWGEKVTEKITEMGASPNVAATAGVIADLVEPDVIGLPGAGVVKKAIKPGKKLFHGTFEKFKTKDIKPSRSGYAGPGIYVTPDKEGAQYYGDIVHEFESKGGKLADFTAPTEELAAETRKFAEKHGLDISKYDPNSKFRGNAYQELIQGVRSKYDNMVGYAAHRKLAELMKKDGFDGIKFFHNDSPDNIVVFDKEFLGVGAKEVTEKITKKNRSFDELIEISEDLDGVKIETDDISAVGYRVYDDIEEYLDMDVLYDMTKKERSEWTERLKNIENPFKVEHLEISKEQRGKGLGSRALAAIENAAKKDGADAIFLNASPLGDKKNLDKLIKFYEKNGFQVIKKHAGNAEMVKILKETK